MKRKATKNDLPKNLADFIRIDFDTPERKDDFLRKLASAKTAKEKADLIFGKDRPDSEIVN